MAKLFNSFSWPSLSILTQSWYLAHLHVCDERLDFDKLCDCTTRLCGQLIKLRGQYHNSLKQLHDNWVNIWSKRRLRNFQETLQPFNMRLADNNKHAQFEVIAIFLTSLKSIWIYASLSKRKRWICVQLSYKSIPIMLTIKCRIDMVWTHTFSSFQHMSFLLLLCLDHTYLHIT